MPTNEQLDPAVVNLAKAIRQVESGGNFTSPGKSGEYGAYQFMPATWDAYSKEFGINIPLTQASPLQQNEVAYKKIKQWKDQGLNVGQIASSWNAGPGKPNAYLENHVGTNDLEVQFDTPTYAKKVSETYQQYKAQGGRIAPAPQKPNYDTYNATFPVSEAELASGNVAATTAKAIGNLPSSFVNLGAGLATAALHPIQTAKGIGSAAIGGVENLLGANQGNPDQNQQTANAVGKAFLDRYGSVHNAARSATNDPAGVGADILSILYGGAAAVDKFAGTTGADIAATAARQGVEDFSQTGLNVMPKQGPGLVSGALTSGLTSVAKPVAAGVKGLLASPFKAASQTMGLQTGVGAQPIREGFNASAAGGEANKAFLEGLRGNSTPEQLVNQARDALGEVIGERSNTYKQMLSSLGKDKTTYDLSPIYSQLDSQLGKFGITQTKDGLDFSRSKFVLDTTAQRDIENLYNYVKSYGGQAGDRTALGIDNLKQVLGGYYSPNSDYRAFVQALKGETRKVLNNAPGYTKAMDDYADMSDTIKDIKQSLSLGDNAATETSFKKLISALKNNDFRKAVVESLDEATGGQLIPKIAGTQLSSAMPRGLAGVFEGGITGATAIFAPHALLPMLGLALTTSPRVVGEFVHALGLGARGTNAVMGVLNKFATPAVLGGNALNRVNPQDNSLGKLQTTKPLVQTR